MDNITDLLINYGLIGIMIAALSEAIFLPIPMELISIPIYLTNPTKSISYSIVLIIFSIIGSIAGYYIGGILGNVSKPLVEKFIPNKNLQKLKLLYDKNAFLTLISCFFTPIPYETYVLSAGMFKINFKKFISATIISRLLRHLPQGIIVFYYGESFLFELTQYSFITSSIIFIAIIVYQFIIKRKKKSDN